MAVAETKIQYDGHWYNPGDELPDLGGLVGRGKEGGVRDYDGHYSDRYKLPKYDDLATGSSAFLSDGGNFYLFMYYADTKTWEGNGEVI